MALQRYQVIERLDAGGMAEVFKGKAISIEGIEKLVAIKRILPALTKHKKFISMFLDEARLSMHLNHANVVQVFDLGVTDNSYFIVMEFVEGSNLKVIFETTNRMGYRIPIPQSIYTMMEVCKGLAHAHSKRDASGRPLAIVHRDVSPPNILLSREGEVKLTDFGLAKAQSQLEGTDPGVVKGKFAYLSPEAAHGEEVDLRSDIFSAGIILWELLAGRRLFQADTDLGVLEQVRRCQIPSLSPLNPEVSPELEQIVQRALARRTSERYSSAQEFGDELAHYIFSRKAKVTNTDLAELVNRVLSGQLGQAPRQSLPLRLIDRLIQDELNLMESIAVTKEGSGLHSTEYDGSRSLMELNWTSPMGVRAAEPVSLRPRQLLPTRPEPPVGQPLAARPLPLAPILAGPDGLPLTAGAPLPPGSADDNRTVVDPYGLVRKPPSLPTVPSAAPTPATLSPAPPGTGIPATAGPVSAARDGERALVADAPSRQPPTPPRGGAVGRAVVDPAGAAPAAQPPTALAAGGPAPTQAAASDQAPPTGLKRPLLLLLGVLVLVAAALGWLVYYKLLFAS